MNNSHINSKKILIVDDEPELLKMIYSILVNAGFTNIISATSMNEGINKCKTLFPDFAILDVMLPDGDGFTLMKQIRTFTDIPIIFLTAKDEVNSKLSGLGLGADDYIIKPFLPQELILRVCAILRRCYKEAPPVLQLDGCTIDFERAEINKNGELLSLTAKEYTLLDTLAKNSGRIVTIDCLCEALWGDNPYGYENSLNVHIRRIREKIENNPSKPTSLVTVKGLGYKLIVRK